MELETKVYKDLSFSVDPDTVKFEFQLDSSLTHTIYVSNTKNRAQRVQIKLPTTTHFKVDLCSQDVLMPGLRWPITVTFTADEMRKFTDEITIDCYGEKSITIPLEAVPKAPRTNIPRQIHWGTLPLGLSTSHLITIYPEPCHEPTFFLFKPSWDESVVTDLKVCPLSGCLGPDDPPVTVVLTCTPTVYTSEAYNLLVFIHTAKVTLRDIRVTWDCKPGVIRDNLLAKVTPIANSKKVLPEVTRPKISLRKTENCLKSNVKPSYYDAIINLQVPNNTHHAISTLLSREPVRERCLFDSLGPLGRYLEEDNEIYDFMQKEFKARGRRYRNESDPISSEQELVPGVEKPGFAPPPKAPEAKGEFNYKTMIEPENVEHLYEQVVPTYVRQRTVRDSIDEEDFDWPGCHSNNTEWFVRYRILSKFIRTARDVVTTNRMTKVLNVLKNSHLVRNEIEPENVGVSSEGLSKKLE